MTTTDMKKSVRQFQAKFHCYAPSCDRLRSTAEKLGYTVVEFSHILNDRDVQTLIDALKLSDAALHSRGFTYANQNYRLLFVHDDLSEEEEQIILAHELGHIWLEHMTSAASVIGRDVQEEYEANEFAHYLLHPGFSGLLRKNLSGRRKRLALGAVVLIAAVVAGMAFTLVSCSGAGGYLVTPTGSKYHTADCGYVRGRDNTRRLSEEELNSGGYQPCEKCIGKIQ